MRRPRASSLCAPRWAAMLERCGGSLHEVVTRYEAALREAGGPLHDVPFRVYESPIAIHVQLAHGGHPFTHCRMRNSADDPREQYEVAELAGGECTFTTLSLDEGHVEVQLGSDGTWMPWHRMVIP